MPRPLIIKIDDHNTQPNRKAVGSISVHVLRENAPGNNKTFYESYRRDYCTNNEHDAAEISQCGKSIVRNLINKYESSASKPNLAKFKSKSLLDLPSTPVAATATSGSQDDFLYNKNIYYTGNSEYKFDFKTVFSKFENPNHLNMKYGSNRLNNICNENINLTNIKEKAKLLLENRNYESNLTEWYDQVIELLQHIGNLDNSLQPLHLNSNVEKADISTLEKDEMVATSDDFVTDIITVEKPAKVKYIKNIFEEKTDFTRSYGTTSASSGTAHFGLKNNGTTDENRKFKNSISIEQLKYFNGESHYDSTKNDSVVDKYFNMSDDIAYGVPDEVDRTNSKDDTLLHQEQSGKVEEIKNFFESQPTNYVPYKKYFNNGESKHNVGKTTEEGVPTMEQTSHIVYDDYFLENPMSICKADDDFQDDDIQISLQKIKDLMNLLEDYELKINNLNNANREEGGYINEHLLRILIELDGITTYREQTILMERKNAMKYVQECIQKLKDKVNE